MMIIVCFHFETGFGCPSSHTEKDFKKTEMASSGKRGKIPGKNPTKRCRYLFFKNGHLDRKLSLFFLFCQKNPNS